MGSVGQLVGNLFLKPRGVELVGTRKNSDSEMGEQKLGAQSAGGKSKFKIWTVEGKK